MATDAVPAAVPGPGDRPDASSSTTPGAPAPGLLASVLAPVTPARPAFDLTPTAGAGGATDAAVTGASSAAYHGDEDGSKDGTSTTTGGRREKGVIRAWLLAGAARWARGGGTQNKRLDVKKARAMARQVKEARQVTVNRSGGLLNRSSGGSGASGSGGKSLGNKGNSGGSGKSPKNSNGSAHGPAGRSNGSSGSGAGGGSGRGPAGGRGTGGGGTSGGKGHGHGGGTSPKGPKADGGGRDRKPSKVDLAKGGTSGGGTSGRGTSGGKNGAQGPAGGAGKDGTGGGSSGKSPASKDSSSRKGPVTKDSSGTKDTKRPGPKDSSSGKDTKQPGSKGPLWKRGTGTAGDPGKNVAPKSGGGSGPSADSKPTKADKASVDKGGVSKGDKTGKQAPAQRQGQQQAKAVQPVGKRFSIKQSRETGYRDGTRAAKTVAHFKAYRDGLIDGYGDTTQIADRETARLDKAHEARNKARDKEQPVNGTRSSADYHSPQPIPVTGVTGTHVLLGDGAARTSMPRNEVRSLKGFERRLGAKSANLTRIAEETKGLKAHADAQAAKAIQLAEDAKAVKGGEKLAGKLAKLADDARVQAGLAEEIHKRAVRAAEVCRVVLANVETRYGGIYKAVVDSDETVPAEMRFYRDQGVPSHV